jgi:hypothetical protein
MKRGTTEGSERFPTFGAGHCVMAKVESAHGFAHGSEISGSESNTPSGLVCPEISEVWALGERAAQPPFSFRQGVPVSRNLGESLCIQTGHAHSNSHPQGLAASQGSRLTKTGLCAKVLLGSIVCIRRRFAAGMINMFRIALCSLLCTVTLGIGATTLRVDGPGDGDGDTTDDFDTVRDALVSLGSQGHDGTPDRIDIAVDAISEPLGLKIFGVASPLWPDYSSLSDDLEIAGDADANGIRCVMDIATVEVVGAAIDIEPTDGQHISLHDLTVIPTHTSAELLDTWPLVVAGRQLTTGASVSLENVWTTASTTGNTSVDPFSDSPPGATVFYGGPAAAGNDSVDLTTLSVHASGCVFAHSLNNGLSIDQGVAGTLVNTQVLRNGERGIFLGWADHTTLDLTRFTCAHNGGHGISAVNVVDEDAVFALTLHPGCVFSDNGTAGIYLWSGWSELTGTMVLRILGTDEEPVLMCGNHASGLVCSRPQLLVPEARHLILCDNGGNGLSLGSEGLFTSSTLFEDCLIAHNCQIGSVSNVQIGPETLGGPSSLEFRHCTFHDVAPSVGPGAGYSQVSISSPSTENLSLHFTNCIFSGTEEEVAFDIRTGTNNVINLTNCAVVFEGPWALGGLTEGSSATLVQTDVINDCPAYLNTDTPPDDRSFDVGFESYRFAGPGGGPLSGWGDFVGGFEACSAVRLWDLYL